MWSELLRKGKSFLSHSLHYFQSLITPSRLLEATKVCFGVRHNTRSVMTSLWPAEGSSGPGFCTSSTFIRDATPPEPVGGDWLPL